MGSANQSEWTAVGRDGEKFLLADKVARGLGPGVGMVSRRELSGLATHACARLKYDNRRISSVPRLTYCFLISPLIMQVTLAAT